MKQYVLGFHIHEGPRYQQPSVVLVRKARPDWQRGKLNGIGGHVEEGETPLVAMEREFREETGLGVADWEHFLRWNGDGYMMDVFRSFTSELRPVHGLEDEPVGWYMLPLAKPTIHNVPWLVHMALDRDYRRLTFVDSRR